jgi:hypothetical protein
VNETLAELGLKTRLAPKLSVRAGTRLEEDGKLNPKAEARAGALSLIGCDIEHEVLPPKTKLELVFTYRKDSTAPRKKVHSAEYVREAGGIIRYSADWHPRETGLFECEVKSDIGTQTATLRVVP